ncbi:MAG: hypothetical protein WDZ72_07000 [Cyclobacteriaceae bacterium]
MTPNLYLICLCIGFLFSISFFYFKNKSRLSEESFLHNYVFFIILYVLLFEFYAIYLVVAGKTNVIVYNIFFVIGETLLILGYLRYLMERREAKRAVFIFAMFFLIWAAINGLYFQKITDLFQHYTHLLGSLGILFFSCYIMYKLLLSERFWDRPLFTVPHFWNVAAILLFYSPSFIYFGSLNLMWDIDRWYLNILASTNRIFAATLYLILGLSFYSPIIFSGSSNGRR